MGCNRGAHWFIFNGFIDFKDIRGNGTFNVRSNHITVMSLPETGNFQVSHHYHITGLVYEEK